MSFLHFLFFFQLLIFLLSHPSHSQNCSSSSCGKNKIQIHFPFRLQDNQPSVCGFPGFDLTCTDHTEPVLKLPKSGKYYVEGIDYITQQISLRDPENCLAKRFLDFDYSGTPFTAMLFQNYTYFRCPSSIINSRYARIDCMSNSTTSVLVTSMVELAESLLPPSCEIFKFVPVPVSWPVWYNQGFTTELNDHDLKLKWVEPNCGDCEEENARCGFKNNNTLEVGCFHVSKSGNSGVGFQIFRILCLSIAAPAAACATGIAVFACVTDSLNSRRRNSATADAAAVTPQPDVSTTGLDETTIESYQKLVLGESRRLPGPNDVTCPICLSEYASEETVRCIPECQHCFHSDCIDEWLRIHNSCPVCRNSPSPVHPHQQDEV